MIIDAHVHLFTPKIIRNVAAKTAMVAALDLQTAEAAAKVDTDALARDLRRAGVQACLLLPTAAADKVEAVNANCLQVAARTPFLHTAGTLHPAFDGNAVALEQLADNGVNGIKLCSFSQGFVLDAPSTDACFDLVRQAGRRRNTAFFVVLDTFYVPDRHFGTDPAFNTTPAKLARQAQRCPEVNFIAAHMGGLLAPFDEIRTRLTPQPNLFLDTSNAAHTLTEDEFVRLVKQHGPTQIIFGTDWPWFEPLDEIPRIERLLKKAGFDTRQRRRVFGENMARLLEG